MRRPHIERLSSGAFSARISDPTRPGVRIRITDDSETKVLARVERVGQLAREIRHGDADPRDVRRRFARVAIGAPTTDEVWGSYESSLRGQWRKKVGSLWRAQIGPLLGGLRIFELTPAKMADWERAQRKAGRGPKTVENAFVALRAAVRAALHDRVDEIPWRNWRPQGPPKGHEPREACRSVAELEALVLACAEYDARVTRAGALGDLAVRVLVLALCGLRQGEAVALGWDALALDTGEPTLTVKYSAHEGWWHRAKGKGARPLDPPKGNKVRTQTLHEHAAGALRHQRERLQNRNLYAPDGPVFPAKGGGWRRTVQAIDPDVLRQCIEAAGLPTEAGKTWTVHSLRHTFATLETWAAWSLTGDVQSAMARTGHTKIETLMGYLRRAGRGRPAPFIPALGAATTDAIALLQAPGNGPPRLPASEIGQRAMRAPDALQGLVTHTSGHGSLESANARKTRPRSSEPRPLAVIAAESPAGTPPEVLKRAEATYRKAYLVAQRGGASPEACRQRAGASKRAFLGAWAKVQATARNRAKAEAGPQ